MSSTFIDQRSILEKGSKKGIKGSAWADLFSSAFFSKLTLLVDV